MPGGFLQLTTYQESGADMTNRDPNITFFKSVYKKYTNFAVENIPVEFDQISSISFTEPMLLQVKIDNIGHILQNIFFILDIPKMSQDNNLKPQWIPNLGIHIIKEMRFIIGGEPIQTFSNDWLEIYYKRYLTYEHYIQALSQINVTPSPNKNLFVNLQNRLYTYLPLYFSKDWGLGLPLLNIEYQDIYLQMIIRPIREWLTIIETTQGSPYFGKRIAPYGNYINQLAALFEKSQAFHMALEAHVAFFDKDAFNILRNSEITYLIEQNQEIVQRDISEKVVDINLNSRIPIKEFWLLGMRNDVYSRNGWNEYTTLDRLSRKDADLTKPYSMLYSEFTPVSFLQQYWANYYNNGLLPVFNIIESVDLYLDEQVRFRDMPSPYMALAQPYMNKINYNDPDYLYNYSFSLEPLQYQPSGFLNMDRIHVAMMRIRLTEKPPLKPLLLVPKKVIVVPPVVIDDSCGPVQNLPQPGNGLYIPNPAEFQPYNNVKFAYLFDIKIILVNYNLLRIKAGMADLLIRR